MNSSWSDSLVIGPRRTSDDSEVLFFHLLQLQIIKPGGAGDLLAFEAEAEAGGDGGFRCCGGEFERYLFPVGRGRNHFAGFGAIEQSNAHAGNGS